MPFLAKKTSTTMPRSVAFSFLFAAAAFTLLFFLFFHPRFTRFSFPARCGAPQREAALGGAADRDVDLRLFVGVLTTPGQFARRSLLRLAYAQQPKPENARVDVRFVLCDVASPEDRVLVAMEIAQYDDIMTLNCTENMNDGKTHDFFSTLAAVMKNASFPYDYVMKTDDDTYVRTAAIAAALERKPRDSFYYGVMIPCFASRRKPDLRYMSGLGYVVSWDLVEWIAASPVARGLRRGPEDLMLGKWFADAGRAIIMSDATPAMYDYREKGTTAECFRHDLSPDTVAVHKLKGASTWARTLHFFNATAGYSGSKLRRVDLAGLRFADD